VTKIRIAYNNALLASSVCSAPSLIVYLVTCLAAGAGPGSVEIPLLKFLPGLLYTWGAFLLSLITALGRQFRTDDSCQRAQIGVRPSYAEVTERAPGHTHPCVVELAGGCPGRSQPGGSALTSAIREATISARGHPCGVRLG
jgi:hypothetical protein